LVRNENLKKWNGGNVLIKPWETRACQTFSKYYIINLFCSFVSSLSIFESEYNERHAIVFV
jgi:hypothetical protein